MKKLLPLLLLSCLFAFVACNKDDDNDSDQILKFDGNNANAPDFGPGTFIQAVRFPSNETEVFKDSLLTEIRFYVQEPPNALTVRVYGPGMNQEPGDLLY